MTTSPRIPKAKRGSAGNSDYDSLLFGRDSEKGLVAVELSEDRKGPDEVVLFFRENETVQRREPFKPFILVEPSLTSRCPLACEAEVLDGEGALNRRLIFTSWKDCVKARQWLAKETGFSSTAPGAPYFFLNDPVQQHLLVSGRTLFLGMNFEDVRRMQVDIECITGEGFEFCNAARPSDRIVAIAMGDQTGWTEVLSGEEMSEKALLERFVGTVRERDPDVLEGHNIFNFDLPYIAERAARHRVKLALGRDGSTPRRRSSRFSVGERTITYDRFDIYGRHVVDTLFMVHGYDIIHRSLSGFGLKEVAVHFGFAAPRRTYIEGGEITREFKRHPKKVMSYVRDDVIETGNLSDMLSRGNFIQAQMLPYSYQNVCVRGTATKIDALMLREYLRQSRAVPKPDMARGFAGGYTDMFVAGVVENVHHCDVRSLYPSLMLLHKLAPRKDELSVFLKLLERLRDVRFEAKENAQKARSDAAKRHFDALQAAFKVLINSFYGYLGFGQARFSDFSVAEKIAAEGRKLIKKMIQWLRERHAVPVEIDTDGIYFVPPPGLKKTGLGKFRKEFADMLPQGIDVEFDGRYRSMYSYKAKNYALLSDDGELIIKGAALKSRGLEPFQRDFLREILELKLTGQRDRIPALKERYAKAIRERTLPIEKLAKTERLQDSPARYVAKRKDQGRARSAVYELALASSREYRAGDQLSFYVSGDKKSVAVHEKAKLVADWNPKERDENVPYYLAKLESLYKKFAQEDAQEELAL